MAVDSVNRPSNPSLPAVKPQEPAKPAPAPAAKATASADGFDSQASLRRSSPGMDVFTPDPVATAAPAPAPAKPSEAKGSEDVTASMSPQQREKYDALTDAERAQYDELARAAANAADPKKAEAEVHKLLDDGKLDEYMAVAGKADPEHQQKLQALLFNGTLLEGKKGETLLDTLAPFSSKDGATATGVDRGQLVNQIIDDVTDPESASRQPDGDRHCGLLTMMGEVARTDPAAYAGMMTQMAEEGSLTLDDGNGNPVTLPYAGPPDPNSPMTLTQQMFVETVEGFANGVRSGGGILNRIVNAIDEYSGLTAQEMADFKQAVLGSNYSPMTVPEAGEATAEAQKQLRTELGREPTEAEVTARASRIREQAAAEAKQTLDEQIAAGEEVQIEVQGPPQHWETVTGKVEINTPFGKIELYRADDGQGNLTLMTPGQLRERMTGMIYNPAVSDVPAGAYNRAHDDPGIGFNRGGGGGDVGD